MLRAPPADAARVASIRNNLDLRDVSAMDSYGERARRDLLASMDRIAAEVRTRDLIESREFLSSASDMVGQLDPRALEKKPGVASWLSNDRSRLSRFRSHFSGASQGLERVGAELRERAERLSRKVQALNGLHEQARSFILELDAYIEAGRQRLTQAGAASDERLEAGAKALVSRLQALERTHNAAVEQLPLVRVIQNVDTPVGQAVGQAIAAVTRWRGDWSEGLGFKLAPRVQMRPDTVGLTMSREELRSALVRLDAAFCEARTRRSEAESHIERLIRAMRAD